MESAKKKLPECFCRACGMRKSNKSFSGRSHTVHIYKTCICLSSAQQAEQVTLCHLESLSLHYLNESAII